MVSGWTHREHPILMVASAGPGASIYYKSQLVSRYRLFVLNGSSSCSIPLCRTGYIASTPKKESTLYRCSVNFFQAKKSPEMCRQNVSSSCKININKNCSPNKPAADDSNNQKKTDAFSINNLKRTYLNKKMPVKVGWSSQRYVFCVRRVAHTSSEVCVNFIRDSLQR